MSRSFKKHPYAAIKGKSGKTMANRKVRNVKEDIPSGSNYKKYYNSWDIVDYYSISSFEEYKKTRRQFNDTRSDEKLYRQWYKEFKRK